MLISVAYLTLAERKVMAGVQRRKGPNVVGFWGFLQPLADGLKLLLKEVLVPSKSYPLFYVIAGVITFELGLVCFSFMPVGYGNTLYDFSITLFYVFSALSLNIYSTILSG